MSERWGGENQNWKWVVQEAAEPVLLDPPVDAEMIELVTEVEI